VIGTGAFAIGIGPRVRKSPYFDATVAAGVTHFTIYNHMYMPLSYGDPEGEYWRLLKGVSMWDVAAERQAEIAGRDAAALVRYLTPRNLGRCRTGRARYIPLCDHEGYIINDPVLLPLAADRFWLSTADSDMIYWVKGIAVTGGFEVEVREPDVSPLAVQGPKAVEVIAALFGERVRSMKHFHFEQTDLNGIPLVLCRSGWSRQGGFELFLMDGSRGDELWRTVARAGASYSIEPGAPNPTERVESGLLSFGADHDPYANLFEVGLGGLVDLERTDDYVGKAALARIAERGPDRKRVGLFIDGACLPANEHPWPLSDEATVVGSTRVVTYSLRLERNIGIALVSTQVPADARLRVESPDGWRGAEMTPLPFC